MAPLLVVGAVAAWQWWQQQNNDNTDSGGAVVGLSNAGLDFIKRHEGFSQYSYPDSTGRSIGYGHFILPTDAISEPISEPDATTLLMGDTGTAVNAVNGAVSASITQYQFDALVDFAYNAGANGFRSSTLLQKVNAGDFAGAAQEFGRWIYTHDASGNKVVSQALVQRRQDEATLFATGNYGQ